MSNLNPIILDFTPTQQRTQSGEQFDHLFFWGHTPAKDGSVTKSCFSQWFVDPFTVDGVVYPTAEHWMMVGKARLFNDEVTLAKILESGDPKTAKALGRQVNGFEDHVWKGNCRRLVTEGNIAKFNQNEGLKEFLLATGTKVLVDWSWSPSCMRHSSSLLQSRI